VTYSEFAQAITKELRIYNQNNLNSPRIKNAYLGYDDLCELKNTISYHSMDITEKETFIYGFKILCVDTQRHFELLVK